MDFERYENEVVARTGKMEEGTEAAKALGALGLCGEAAEVYELAGRMSVSDAMRVKETGDVLWYVGYLARAYGIPLKAIANNSSKRITTKPEGMLMLECGRLADVVKKEIFHAKPTSTELIQRHLSRVLDCLLACIANSGATIEEVMLANQAKLLARFPNGWNTNDATAKADEAR